MFGRRPGLVGCLPLRGVGLLHPALIGGRRTEHRGRNGALAALRSVVRRLLSVFWTGMRFERAVLVSVLGRPGGDLLSHVLGRSTIGAEGFHGRVRDGIGCRSPRHNHQVVAEQITDEVLSICRGVVDRL